MRRRQPEDEQREGPTLEQRERIRELWDAGRFEELGEYAWSERFFHCTDGVKLFYGLGSQDWGDFAEEAMRRLVGKAVQYRQPA